MVGDTKIDRLERIEGQNKLPQRVLNVLKNAGYPISDGEISRADEITRLTKS